MGADQIVSLPVRSRYLHSIKHMPVEGEEQLPRETECLVLLGLWADTDEALVGGLAAERAPR